MRLRTLLATLLVTACSDAAADGGWTATIDTLPNGAVRVVNTPPPAGAEPAWVLEEELRIGAIDEPGPASFGQIKALVVLDDGRIAVLDAQPQEVRVFSSDGAHLATYGGRGGGPGELQNALGIMLTSDGVLFVPDQRNGRMNVIDPDDGFITSHPLNLYRWGFVWDGAMRDDDHIIIPSMVRDTRRDLLRIHAPDMTQVDSILLPERPPAPDDPPGAFAWEAPGGLPRGFIGVPFYPAGGLSFDRTGAVWSSAGGDPSYRIARWMPGGDTTLVIETRREPIPVTAAERDSAVNSILEYLEQYQVTRVDASKIPAVKPSVLGTFIDDEGRIWVRTSSPDSLLRYDIYESDGRFAASVATPLRIVTWIRPAVRDGRFHAIVTDDLDVQYIVRARLVERRDDE